jgi:hypothetical protein
LVTEFRHPHNNFALGAAHRQRFDVELLGGLAMERRPTG